MMDNIEIKIENLRLQECSLKRSSFWKLLISLETYMKQTVTSGLCYIEDLSFLKIIELDFENLCMFSQPIVQWNYKISYLRFLF